MATRGRVPDRGDMTRFDASPAVSVVVATRDRRASLARTLEELTALPSRPPVIVVDNGSGDGTVEMVRSRFPEVTVMGLGRNRGAAARNLGVAGARTPLVAFADDDSWWEPGALARAAAEFQRSPSLGLLAGRIVYGSQRRLDPTSGTMAEGRIGVDAASHPRILGFVACGAVVRKEAFRQAGGFDQLLFFMGEERTLALDMASRGWDLVYVPEVVAVHMPESVDRDRRSRHRRQVRNGLLSSIMTLPWRAVMGEVSSVATGAVTDRVAAAGLADALKMAPRALARRRPIPRHVERQRRKLEASTTSRLTPRGEHG